MVFHLSSQVANLDTSFLFPFSVSFYYFSSFLFFYLYQYPNKNNYTEHLLLPILFLLASPEENVLHQFITNVFKEILYRFFFFCHGLILYLFSLIKMRIVISATFSLMAIAQGLRQHVLVPNILLDMQFVNVTHTHIPQHFYQILFNCFENILVI